MSTTRASRATPRLRLIAAGVVPFALTWPLLFRGGANDGSVVEFRSYGDLIMSGQVPYRDFHPEYPPGSLPFLVLPSLAHEHLYLVLFEWLSAVGVLLGLVLLALLVERLALPAPLAYGTILYAALVPALLGAFVLRRFDMWPEALCVAALVLLIDRRPRAALAVLALATVTKTYPVALLPVALVYAGRAAWRSALAVYCVVGFVLLVPWAILGHVGLYLSYATQWNRHLQIETIGAGVLLALHRPVRIAFDAGSWSLFGGGADAVAQVHTLLQALSVVVPTLLFWRSSRTARELVIASVAILAGVACFGKVLSPQFLLWFAPLVPLAGSVFVVACSTAALLATNLIFPDRYDGLLARHGGEIALLCARNGLLVVVVAALAAALYRTSTGGESRIRSPSSLWIRGPATRPTR